jgi:hypothetical protein
MDDCDMQTNKNKRAPETDIDRRSGGGHGWEGWNESGSRLASTLRKVEKDDDEGEKIRSIQE